MEVDRERLTMLLEKEILSIAEMIPPIICGCSNTSEHITEHVECRCNGQRRFNAGMIARYPEKFLYPANLIDEQDFFHCRFCGKIRSFPGYLVECPSCGKLFKGPRPYFPVDYECPECDV